MSDRRLLEAMLLRAGARLDYALPFFHTGRTNTITVEGHESRIMFLFDDRDQLVDVGSEDRVDHFPGLLSVDGVVIHA